MRKVTLISILFLVLFSLSACKGLKSALSGSKADNSDEFLVQKKNPLVLPPDFNDLPIPYVEKDEEILSQDNTDNKKLLGVYQKESTTKASSSKKIKTLKKEILKKIKKN